MTVKFDVITFYVMIFRVKVYNLFDRDNSEDDVLIMASDGLWDVLSNDRVAEVVREVLNSFPPNDYKK